MPLKFAFLCQLFDELEKLEYAYHKLGPSEKQQKRKEIVRDWFAKHRRTILSPESDLVAILSTLFPEHRTDRVYNIQPLRLLNVLSRGLYLGSERLARLKLWKTSTGKDLASWTSQIVKETDDGTLSPVTVEQIDRQLEQLAARCHFSAPTVRARMTGADSIVAHDLLGPIARQLPSRELKWFIRLTLKDFSKVQLVEYFVQSQVHFLLPRLLQFQSTFEAAVRLMQDPRLAHLAGSSSANGIAQLTTPVRHEILRPCIGIKVGRPNFVKARSLKHCLQVTKQSRWSVEAKYDGEYCQVHIDLSNKKTPIQNFAKSGKDATNDRRKVHEYIRKCLKIGTNKCAFREKCILEGELVVYDDKAQGIAPFHKIRKHVSRSGLFLGTEYDSQAHSHERLIIIFYDCLLVDEEVTMAHSYGRRRKTLHALLSDEDEKKSGRPPLINRSNRGTIDFAKLSPSKATRIIKMRLSQAIAQRCEGLILKPEDGPYFSLDNSKGSAGSFIKLKKDYIQGLGDSADFAVIGARRDLKNPGAVEGKWTHLIIATIENKDDVRRFGVKAIYRIMDSLTRPCIPPRELEHMLQHGSFMEETFTATSKPLCFTVLSNAYDAKMDVVFKKPFIVEILGSSFDKASSRNYWMLRHPRITKLHLDRGLEDVVSFEDLQALAKEAMSVPEDVDAEEAEWRRKLALLSKPKRGVLACSTSPSTETTTDRATTESISTNVTTPSRPPKSRPPLVVRMDSVEIRPGDERTASAEAPSTVNISPVSSHPSSEAVKEHARTSPRQQALLDNGKLANRRQAIHRQALVPVRTSRFLANANAQTVTADKPSQPNAAADGKTEPIGSSRGPSLRGGSGNASKSRSAAQDSCSSKRSRCRFEDGRSNVPRQLKRSRTEPDVRRVAPEHPSNHKMTQTHNKSIVRPGTVPSMRPQIQQYERPLTRSGLAGESQANFYDALTDLHPASPIRINDDAASRDDAVHDPTTSRPSANRFDSLFSAPWSNLRAQLLISSPSSARSRPHSSTVAFRPALLDLSFQGRTQDPYLTPPSTRSPVPGHFNSSTTDTSHQAQSNPNGPLSTSPIPPKQDIDSTLAVRTIIQAFKDSTIYLPPATSTHIYLTHTLLPRLGPVHTTTDLAHWKRALHSRSLPQTQEHLQTQIPSQPYPPRSSIPQPREWHWPPAVVPESQALAHLQKIMLVESRMKTEMDAVIDAVKSEIELVREHYVPGFLFPPECIEVWDWRVVEELVNMDEAIAPDAAGGRNDGAARKWFIGHIRWDRNWERNVCQAAAE